MSRALRRLAPALAVVALACGAGDDGPAEPDTASADPSPRYHTRYGFPGPWSREGASRTDFDTDSNACLARSNDARRNAPEGTRDESAYRAFIDCMDERGWARGVKPRRAG